MVEIWDPPNEGPAFPKQFTFDYTYDENSTTEVIYNDICYPLVEVRLTTAQFHLWSNVVRSQYFVGQAFGPNRISSFFFHF